MSQGLRQGWELFPTSSSLESREGLPETQNALSQALLQIAGVFQCLKKPAQTSPWWAPLGSSFGHLKTQPPNARHAGGNCSRKSKGSGYSQFLVIYQP